MTATIPQSVEQLLQTTVGIDTVNSNYSHRPTTEAPLADYLEALAKTMGFETRRMPIDGRADNLLVTHRVAAGNPWLLFESHMDTVVVDGMTIEPFGGKISEGKLWGRGSCDTKGTGAAMLWAMRRYAASSAKPNNIATAFTIDEEYGMTGVRSLISDYPTLGFKPVGVIVGEPTMLRPVVAHNGCVRWRVTTHGIAAHAADPSKGRSAIAHMVRVIDAIETRYISKLTARDPLTGKAQCSINLIQGGTQINIIPAQCEIRIDRRLVPGEDPAKVLPEIDAILRSLAAAHPGFKFELDSLFSAPPLGNKHNAALLAIIQQTLGSMGRDPAPCGVPYATDAGDLDQAGIAAVVIGPGDIAQAHTKDEWITLEQLHKGVDVYFELMKSKLA